MKAKVLALTLLLFATTQLFAQRTSELYTGQLNNKITVHSIGSSFENESKTIAVHCQVKGNKKGLIDGMNITGIVSLNDVTTPAVPNNAIVNADGKYYIFVETDKEPDGHNEEEHSHEGEEADDHMHEKTVNFEKIEVLKGVSEMGYTGVTLLNDIPKNAKIVVENAFFVNAKLENNGGHAH